MKVFISHKNTDSPIARDLAREFERLQVPVYLDTIDAALSKPGYDLAEYILSALRQCTHLLAVVSPATKDSWWVPWEIGAASER